MTAKLKPCPFCGGQAEFSASNATFCAIFCVDCGAEIKQYSKTAKDAAIERWNTRENGAKDGE